MTKEDVLMKKFFVSLSSVALVGGSLLGSTNLAMADTHVDEDNDEVSSQDFQIMSPQADRPAIPVAEPGYEFNNSEGSHVTESQQRAEGIATAVASGILTLPVSGTTGGILNALGLADVVANVFQDYNPIDVWYFNYIDPEALEGEQGTAYGYNIVAIVDTTTNTVEYSDEDYFGAGPYEITEEEYEEIKEEYESS